MYLRVVRRIIILFASIIKRSAAWGGGSKDETVPGGYDIYNHGVIFPVQTAVGGF